MVRAFFLFCARRGRVARGVGPKSWRKPRAAGRKQREAPSGLVAEHVQEVGVPWRAGDPVSGRPGFVHDALALFAPPE
eukprot:11166284-Lingulodinium_polyedra.AAC.1